MPIDEINVTAQYSMDLLGIFAFALSGAILAVRKDFDVFGTIILSSAAGLGGGLFRDIVLDVPPVGFTNLGYFFTPCIAALMVYFGLRLRSDERVHQAKVFNISDAAALGIFSVTGTIKALDHGFNSPAAVTLGSISAFGGGVLANLLALEMPTQLHWNRDLYVLPALAGATCVAILQRTGYLNLGTAIGSALFAFALRVLALRYNWRTPRSHFWRSPFAGMREQPSESKVAARVQAPTIGATIAIPSSEKDTATVVLSRPGEDKLASSADHSRPFGETDPDPRFLLQRLSGYVHSDRNRDFLPLQATNELAHEKRRDAEHVIVDHGRVGGDQDSCSDYQQTLNYGPDRQCDR
ncbi:trimeric intracellular cation channel family protein [Streptomyces sp. NPDC001185]|uniref:trimeric intracellular cation channel family protein n=1 Tax=Streptomyces sp. NPDC001185 TaxID=3154380 RepID=UPI00331FCABC